MTACAEEEAVPSVPCIEQAQTVLDPAVATSLGFSVDAVTSFALGSHGTMLEWQALDRVEGVRVLNLPPGGESALTLTIEPDAERLPQAIVSKLEGDVAPAVDDEFCPDRLEVPVRVGLWTGEGMLAEQFNTELIAVTPHMAHFRHDLPVSSLAGGLQRAALELEDNAFSGSLGPTEISLEFTVSPLGANGIVASRTDVFDADDIWASELGLVHAVAPTWAGRGAELDCLRWGSQIQTPGDQLDALELRTIDTLVRQTLDWRVRWSDLSELPIEFELEYLAGSACYIEGFPGADVHPLVLDVAFMVRAASADGRFTASFPTRAQLQFSAARTPIFLVLSSRAVEEVLPAALHPQRIAVAGVDTSGADYLGVEFDGRFRVVPNDALLPGEAPMGSAIAGLKLAGEAELELVSFQSLTASGRGRDGVGLGAVRVLAGTAAQ